MVTVDRPSCDTIPLIPHEEIPAEYLILLDEIPAEY
jgi:hypothetical protein